MLKKSAAAGSSGNLADADHGRRFEFEEVVWPRTMVSRSTRQSLYLAVVSHELRMDLDRSPVAACALLAAYATVQSGYQSGQFPARPYCLFTDPGCFAAGDNITAVNFEVGVKGRPLENGGEVAARLGYSYRDRMWGEPSSDAGRLTRIESRSLVNFHFGYTAPGNGWTAAVYGRNAADVRYDNARLNTGDYLLRILSNDASEFGVRIERRL